MACRHGLTERHPSPATDDIFASDMSVEQVTDNWYNTYMMDAAVATTDLVNFIILCTGCEETVTVDDILDLDNIQARLATLQSEYQLVSASLPFFVE